MQAFGYNITIGKFGKRDLGSRPTNPTDDRWYQPFSFSQPSSSGQIVNPTTVLMHPTVYSCVKVITETLATMPCILYKRLASEARERASDHALYRVLRIAPNPRMTAFEFFEMMFGHYLLRGNAYAEIILRVDGEIDSLWPLHPDRMQVLVDSNNEMVYKYQLQNGQTVELPKKKILHLRGPSSDGLIGRSPIDCFKEVVGLGLSMQSYAGHFFGNSASPTGILTLPQGQTLGQKAKDRLREDWKKKFSGQAKGANIAVLEDGLTWQQIGMSSADAQYVEMDKDNDLKICRMFRMPPHKVSILDNAKYNNIESQAIEFITDTILPHATRAEQVITRDLLVGEKPDKYFPEFMADYILRGDQVSRYKSFSIGRQWGWLSVNEIRAKENMNSIGAEGDVYLQPLNMIDVESADDVLLAGTTGQSQPGNKAPGADPSDPTLKNTLKRAVIMRFAAPDKKPQNSEKTPENDVKIEKKGTNLEDTAEKLIAPARAASVKLFSDMLSRVIVKECGAAQTARRNDKFEKFSTEFYESHRGFVAKSLEYGARTYFECVGVVARSAGGQWLPQGSLLDGAIKQVIDETIDHYYTNFKESGDKIDDNARALGEFLTKQIERVGIWELNNVTRT